MNKYINSDNVHIAHKRSKTAALNKNSATTVTSSTKSLSKLQIYNLIY